MDQERDGSQNGDFGEEKAKFKTPMVDVHVDKPRKYSVKVRIPAKEHPRYNFVGKLLGPGGSTLRDLKMQTGCTLAIMGRGSMRDKEKEEELRNEGGKYAHLNEELHVYVECYADAAEAYSRMSGAMAELKNYLNTWIGYGREDNSDEIARGGKAMRGKVTFRGALLSARGGPRGGGPVGRGGPGARGSLYSGPLRNSPYTRGAPPSKRARGGPPPSGYGGGYGGRQSYDDYDNGDYASGGYDDGYEGGYEGGY